MVKFSFLALAGAIATATAAKHNTSIKLGKRQLRRGDASTEALLKKARPYKKANAGRKLEGQQDAVELDGSYSVKFSQCVDVRTKISNHYPLKKSLRKKKTTMVKFPFIGFVGSFAVASFDKHHTSIKLGKRQLRRGDTSTEALFMKARPFKNAHTGRKLEGQEDAAELDGSYSVKFSQCVDVRTKNEDLFSDELIAYAQSGSVVSSKSFVLFHVCQGDNCYYESDDDLYIVDLGTYLANVATYHADKRQNFCEACEQFQDTCVVEEEEVAEDDAAEEEEAAEEDGAEGEAEEGEDEPEEEGEGEEAEGQQAEGEEDEPDRKLKTASRRTANYIDCDQCLANNCYADDEADGDLDDGAQQQQNMDELERQVSEWIANLGECQESGSQDANGNNLYIGVMCDSYGDGVELAVFLDEECSMYTSQHTFNSVYNPNYDDNEINYVTYAENYIKIAFEETMSCLEVEYDDPNEEQDGNAAEEEEERYEMNEYCEGLLNESSVGIAHNSVYNPDYDANEINYVTYAENYIKIAFEETMSCLEVEYDDPNEEQDGNAAEEEEERYEMNEYCEGLLNDEAMDFNNCEAENGNEQEEEAQDDQYSWYTFDIEDADDIGEVCQVVYQMQGEYYHAYDESSSGTWYSRNSNGQIITVSAQNNQGNKSPGLSGGAIAGIVVLIVGVIGVAGFVLTKKNKAATTSAEYQGGQLS
eukprot:CAMPEP_0171357300 /NCGR_PEP_ID=MMETSP0878-20121228/46169_1 /TAXON_ID=67004 /ORGANISM="Thalassiosira weissflogii, Strain CCMP1336" /LENGTH=701 /DNA_ID=CAMNT_0011863339 /DNA_START=100 /DNA_END=2204 /DNA_ORIENTATION=-